MVEDLAALVDETLPDWIDSHVDFATSMVDRITPATTDEDRALVEKECGCRCISGTDRTVQRVGGVWCLPGRSPALGGRWRNACR